MSPTLADFPVVLAQAPGLAPSRTVMPNGITVLAKTSRKTASVTIQLTMRAGSVCDPDDAPGAMFLLGKMLDRGTALHSASEIAEALEDRGAALAVSVTRHLLTLSCTCLTHDLTSVLSVIADVVMNPSFPESELAIQKGEVVTLIKQDADSPAVRAVEGLMSLLYGAAHPYGRPSKGTAETVTATTRETLAALHQSRFAPAAMILAIVGDLTAEEAFAAAERAFSGWQTLAEAPPLLPSVDSATSRRQIVLPMMNKSQADIAYGFTTIPRRDPDYYAFWLLNTVVGHYAMGGRLGDNIRERQGMAYYASSSLDANVLPGPFTVRAGVSAANVERAIRAIDEELTTLARDGITPQELADSRQYMIGSMPRALETNAGIAQFLSTCEWFELGHDYDTQLYQLLGAVTLDHVRDLARRYLDPDRATIVIAGPYEG